MVRHMDFDDDEARAAKGDPTLGQFAGVESLAVAAPLIEAAIGVPVQLDEVDVAIATGLQRARAAVAAADALAAYVSEIEAGGDARAEFQAARSAAARWMDVRAADYRPTVLGVRP